MIKILQLTFNPFQENTYILYNEHKDAVIIDPGMFFPEEKELLQNTIKEHQLNPTQLWLTHAHIDHVMGLNWVNENYRLEPYLHKEDQIIFDNAAASGARFGLKFDNYEGDVHYLSENDTLTIGEDQLSILFAPGHSPGSICFFNAAQQFLIGGDVLFKNSIGRTDLPGGDTNTLLQSIKTKLFALPDETVVYAGHGEPTTIGYEKANNPFLK